MKWITLEKVLWSLDEMSPEVKVPEETRLRAKAAVDKMLEIRREA
jgi:quinolinate synthase